MLSFKRTIAWETSKQDAGTPIGGDGGDDERQKNSNKTTKATKTKRTIFVGASVRQKWPFLRRSRVFREIMLRTIGEEISKRDASDLNSGAGGDIREKKWQLGARTTKTKPNKWIIGYSTI